MRRFCVVLPLMLLFMMSCDGNKKVRNEGSDAPDDSTQMGDSNTLARSFDDILMPKAADELFDDFIFNFSANRKLQMERIAFPLKVSGEEKSRKIQKSEWKMECFFMHQGYYTLLFDNEKHMEIVKDTNVRHAVVEKIYFKSEQVKQYVFDRIRGLWMLTSVQTIPFNEALNSTFLPFYYKFATDKDFQQHHLSQTVRFVGPDPDDDFSQMEGIITPDTWEAFAPQLPSKMIYNIIYGDPKSEGNHKIFVLRGIANGMELQMTFRKKGGVWKLTMLTT